MKYHLVKDVNPSSQQWAIKVRIVRVCDYKGSENPPRRPRINFVALDEEKTAMEGEILDRWIPHFKHKIKEDHIYYIKYFQVQDAKSFYRAVPHAYIMRFTPHTKIEEVHPMPENFPKYAYAAVPFEMLYQRVNKNEFTSDVVGIFIGCTHTKLQRTGDGYKPLRNVSITDGRETASIALWNENAEAFEAERYMEEARQHPLVFLFCALTCRLYEGKLSLQSSSVCKWYANPDIPEVKAIRISCADRIPEAIWFGPQLGQNEPQRISISDLAGIGNPHKVFNKRYTVTAKIKTIQMDHSWWYLACRNCNRKAHPHGDSYRCAGKSCSSTTPVPRYRLSVNATDPSPSTENDDAAFIRLVFFGPHAEEIIGAPVDVLLSSDAGVGNSLPTRITDLCNKSFDLQISVSGNSFQEPDISYQVNSVVGVPTQPISQLRSAGTSSSECSKQIATETPDSPADTPATNLRTITFASHTIPICQPQPVAASPSEPLSQIPTEMAHTPPDTSITKLSMTMPSFEAAPKSTPPPLASTKCTEKEFLDANRHPNETEKRARGTVDNESSERQSESNRYIRRKLSFSETADTT